MNLDTLIAKFREHLWLPDPTPLLIMLAAVVANHLPGDPVWVLLVGPPSSGKTELLSALSTLDGIYEVSTFTKAGLLSGSLSNRPDATGGLLAEIGAFGIIVGKDFTSLLSESSETRAGVFAALREIYDGQWSRRVGTAGGTNLAWRGKVGLLAATTETIDRHVSAIGAMGERFVFCRMPTLDEHDRLAQARAALTVGGTEPAARAALADAVHAFLTPHLNRKAVVVGLEIDLDWLVRLADLATRCRSVVERDARDRQVELVPQPEAAARLAKVLAQLGRGLQIIGVAPDKVSAILRTVALDALPKTRRAVIDVIVNTRPGSELTAADVADRIGLPTDVTARALDDLAAHAIVRRESGPGQPHRWGPTDWLRNRWEYLFSSMSTPQLMTDIDDVAETEGTGYMEPLDDDIF